jgi:hypothetical protein
MRNLLIYSFSFLFTIPLVAQNADALVKAEKAFEQTCLKMGIRDGFLAWVESSGIEFTEKGPSNARNLWTSYPSIDGIFSWSPSYAEMSITGDWGYTTGNYEHRPKSLQDAADETGQYTTVWHKNKKGEWKYLVDIGNRHAAVALQRQANTIVVPKFKAALYTDSAGLADLEKIFAASVEKNAREAYKKFGSSQYILNLPQHQLVKGVDSALLMIQSFSSPLLYRASGVFISPGRDMAAVYGSIGEPSKPGSYLRIWRCEKNGWKIALEVIRM